VESAEPKLLQIVKEASNHGEWCRQTIWSPQNLGRELPLRGIWFWNAFSDLCAVWRICEESVKDLVLGSMKRSWSFCNSWLFLGGGLFRSEQAGGSCGDSELKTQKNWDFLKVALLVGTLMGWRKEEDFVSGTTHKRISAPGAAPLWWWSWSESCCCYCF
jgi:hypothetical protein